MNVEFYSGGCYLEWFWERPASCIVGKIISNVLLGRGLDTACTDATIFKPILHQTWWRTLADFASA